MTAGAGPRTAEERAYHHGNLRAALVAAGTELARTGGPNAVLLRAVSRAAGVSHNAAYRHFANQEDLLAAVSEQCMLQLSRLMTERMDAVTARGRAQRAEARLRAIGRAYIDFARTEPGWFRTAFSSARAHAPDPRGPDPRPADPREPDPPAAGQTPASPEDAGPPNPFTILSRCLDDLADAGALAPERRPGAEYVAWSAVHGLSSLLLDGPLRELPEPEAEWAIASALAGVNRGLLG
jgi:AcrR family transcriptional regulator